MFKDKNSLKFKLVFSTKTSISFQRLQAKYHLATLDCPTKWMATTLDFNITLQLKFKLLTLNESK